MKSCLVALLALFAIACTEPALPETKVIVGATLIDGINPPLEHSVIVVREDKISAVGPQQTTPIPAGSEKVEAYGKYVAAATDGLRIVPGGRADLILLSSNDRAKIERRMVAGKWVDR